MIRISNWAFSRRQSEGDLLKACEELHGLQMSSPDALNIVREAVDKRQKKKVRYVYTVEVQLNINISVDDLIKKNPGLHFREFSEAERQPFSGGQFQNHQFVVVGAGPAGLFAAYGLAKRGARVTLLERGAAVPERITHVKRLFREGALDEENNICFGEGGAGTFSDGKLTTRKNHPWIRWILEFLVECGAPAEIAHSAKPHIGSDRLRAVLIQLRKKLVELGVEFHFASRVVDFRLRDGVVVQLQTSDGRVFEGLDGVVWATGHSARDSFELLHEKGISMECKPFAVGFRIEHPQEMVNSWQNQSSCLEAADYSVVHNFDRDRSVYSFCMCPGGQVVCSSSHAEYSVVNGMSNYARNARFANAGLVIKVSEKDFEGKGPLAGMHFQMKMERKAYQMAGSSYLGAAQRVSDFLAAKVSTSLLPTSYQPGLYPADLHHLYPEEFYPYFVDSLKSFERKFPGFAGEEAQLIGVETRTSSPVRIVRDERGVSPDANNFYPTGEGAGYAGGIISAALDGLFIAGKAAGVKAHGN